MLCIFKVKQRVGKYRTFSWQAYMALILDYSAVAYFKIVIKNLIVDGKLNRL